MKKSKLGKPKGKKPKLRIPKFGITERLAEKYSAKRMRGSVERLERRLGITRLGVMGLGLAVVLWLFARLVAGKTLYLFAYGAFLLIVITWATARRHLPLEGSRSELRGRAREGETLGVELTLRAKRRLATIVLEEEIPDRLGSPVRLPIATLRGGEEVHHSYRLQCRRRGAYKIGPLVARWGDPIGVTQREMVLAEAFEVLVHPSIEPAVSRPLTRQFEDPPIRPPISKPWPTGLEFYGMKDYSPGDDLRRVVWKAFARTGRMLVREAEQGITDQISIILDTDSHFHSREDPSESFEMGVKAAASLGVRHLTEGYSVRVEVNSGALTRNMRGPGAPIEMLDALARVETERKSLDDSVVRIATLTKASSHFILITPRLRREAAGHLRLLLSKGVSVMVVALIWDEAAEETLNVAASLGCQVVELRPDQTVAGALALEVGAGRRR